MTSELSSKPTIVEAGNDEKISGTTSTKQHPPVNSKIKKCSKSTGNSPNLCGLKVVITKLDAASMIVAPLPRRVGFSVQPPSATINPLNKSLVPGVGNYPARKPKRSANALSCCVGCMAGNPCKRTKPSGTQVGSKSDKNEGLKKKYVKRSSTTPSKRRSGVRFGRRSMLNPSMVHQYRFDPQRHLSDVSALHVDLPVGMEPVQPRACTTVETLSTSSPVCSSTEEVSPVFYPVSCGNSLSAARVSTGFLAAAQPSAITTPGIVSSQQSHFAPNATAAVSNTGIPNVQLSQFSPNPAAAINNPGVARVQLSQFSPNPAAARSNPGVAKVQLSQFSPNLAAAVSNPGVTNVQLSQFSPNPTAVVGNPGVTSPQQSQFFPSLPPLPLQQPYVTAIPIYAPSNLLPLCGPLVQAGNPFIPAAHNTIRRPPSYSLVGHCSLPPQNNSQQLPTGAVRGGALNHNPLTSNVACLNSASFQIQTQHGNCSVNTRTVRSNCAEDQVSYGAIAGSQRDNVVACSGTSVEHTVSTTKGNAVHLKDCVGSNRTSISHHGYNIGASSANNTTSVSQHGYNIDAAGTNNSTIRPQPQSDSENMFSISSLLPEMPSGSGSTLQGTMPSGRKRKVRPRGTNLKKMLTQVCKTDISDYRWLTEDQSNCRYVFDIPTLKKLIDMEETHLKSKNGQLSRSCEKLQQSIGTLQENIQRDTKKYNMIAKKLQTSEKRNVKQMETELHELSTKMKILFDGLDELERKWLRKEGKQLVPYAIRSLLSLGKQTL